jgi:hypothetical protein
MAYPLAELYSYTQSSKSPLATVATTATVATAATAATNVLVATAVGGFDCYYKAALSQRVMGEMRI